MTIRNLEIQTDVGKARSLLALLQFVSPALPVGAYSYSEGVETLVQKGKVKDLATLEYWLQQELKYGAISVEAIALLRAYTCVENDDRTGLKYWNEWLSAFRETEEIRRQSWQMGRSLTRLLIDLQPLLQPAITACEEHCNFTVAFAIAADHWQIDPQTALLGYLYSWAANLANAGVRLIPLGQTQGQQLLLNLYPVLERTATTAMNANNDSLKNCGWGLAIASMQHETLYSRLFRS
ncbi:MAG: urease accessory protein UreF [Leptolyngbyaceae cyanobacterium CSU_1_4]|nr:urease accessory protein UreF [Leptolyngbyaceae cyanobacterium CSU_1_4]